MVPCRTTDLNKICLFFTWNFHRCNLKPAQKALQKQKERGSLQAAAAIEIIQNETGGWEEDAKRKFKMIARGIFEEPEDEEENDALNQCTESNDEQEIDSDIERMQETRLESSFQFSAALTEPATKNPLVND